MKTTADHNQMDFAQPSAPSSTHAGGPDRILFWAAVCFFIFWALGSRGLWGLEGRWAEITREMFLRGDFFHPTVKDNPYFDKPLLGYWLIALSSLILGRLDEWAVRLPSAVSGLAGIWATVYLGRKLWSDEVAGTAGWMLLTSYGILFWTRTGAADMENLAAITLAVAWYWARREKPNFISYLGFYLICFLGAHTKGLTAVVAPALLVLPDVLRGRRWRNLLTLSHVLAFTAGLALYLAPFIYAAMTAEGYSQNGLVLVFRENILRFVQPFDHVEPPYVYLYYLPLFFLPWAPLLLTAVAASASSFRRMDPATRWLAEASVLIFVFFTFSGSRRNYYILPLLPFCALFTSAFLMTQGKERWQRLGLGLQAGLLVLVCLIEIASLGLWPMIKARTGFVPSQNLKLSAPILGLLALTPWLIRRAAPSILVTLTGTRLKMAPLVLSAAVLMGGFFWRQQVILSALSDERNFARSLKAQVMGSPSVDMAFYKDVSPKVLFYADYPGPVQILNDLDSARSFIQSDKEVKFLVSNREYIPELLPVLPEENRKEPDLIEKYHAWDQEKIPTNMVAWKIIGKGK